MRESWITEVLKTCPGARLVLLVDETKLSGRLSMMMVSMLTKDGAIPPCWRVYQPTGYPEERQVEIIVRMLKLVRHALASRCYPPCRCRIR